jgi:hypothetical protein
MEEITWEKHTFGGYFGSIFYTGFEKKLGVLGYKMAFFGPL